MKNITHHLANAESHALDLREWAAVKAAEAISARGWTQTQAAQYLNVRQPRVSDLMRGKTHKFTLDTLVEWLYALDKPVKLVELGDPRWGETHGRAPSAEENEAIVARYTRVIQADPRDWIAYSRRGQAYSALRQYELAIGDFTRAIELEPSREGPRCNRASVFTSSGQYAAALLEFEEISRRWPESNYFQNRGLLYERMERYEEALSDQEEAARRDPGRPGPHWNRATVLEKLGRRAEAAEAYRACYALDHTVVQARERAEKLAEPDPTRQVKSSRTGPAGGECCQG